MSESVASTSAETSWAALRHVWFRFCFAYFVLYCVLTQIILSIVIIPKVDLPDPATLAPVRTVVFWVGAHLFKLRTPLVYSGSGSGDKYFDYVLVFCILVIAIFATTVWSLLDGAREQNVTLRKWFSLFLRFCLGGQMLIYGGIKAVPLQMHYPFLFTQIEPFGNFSPMGVLWNSVGAAPAYETFAGCAELLAAFLLMFPRTVVLGALICLADLTQIFVLNMTYDVPVKQFSFHLLLMALLLLAPHLRQLANLLLLQKPAYPLQPCPLFATRRAQRIAAVSIASLWLWMIGNNAYGMWDGWRQYGSAAPKAPFYGIWNIEEYRVDGHSHPLLVTESQQWRRMVFDFPGLVQVEHMDATGTGYEAKIDQAAHTLVLMDRRNKEWNASFSFVQPAQDRLSLDGTINAQKTTILLHRLDHTKLQLNARGFHWIQDYPFNR